MLAVLLGRLATVPGTLPGAVSQGLIWGVMAIGVYITFRVLDIADLTVDGSMATGGAVCIMLMLGGLVLFHLGIIGKYMANIYREVKRRPIYLIRETDEDLRREERV